VHNMDLALPAQVIHAAGFIAKVRMSRHRDKPLDFSGFQRRLSKALGGMSRSELAVRTGLSKSALTKYFDGTEPGLFKGALMARELDVGLSWLASGVPDEPAARLFEIEVFEAGLKEGTGAINERMVLHTRIAVSESSLSIFNLPTEKTLLGVICRGDAMDPTVKNQSLVLVDPARPMAGEGLYLVTLGRELKVRRLRYTGFADIEMICDNPKYPAETLTPDLLDHFTVIGPVVWTGTRF